MKKFFAILMALMMIFAMVACSSSDNDSSDNGGEKSKPVEEVFGLDLESTEEQPMSEECGERDALYAAVKNHFGDRTFFSGTDFAKTTYDDLKELLGFDATYYYYDEDASAQTFVWKTCDHENSKLAFFFQFDELYALGSVNMKG